MRWRRSATRFSRTSGAPCTAVVTRRQVPGAEHVGALAPPEGGHRLPGVDVRALDAAGVPRAVARVGGVAGKRGARVLAGLEQVLSNPGQPLRVGEARQLGLAE